MPSHPPLSPFINSPPLYEINLTGIPTSVKKLKFLQQSTRPYLAVPPIGSLDSTPSCSFISSQFFSTVAPPHTGCTPTPGPLYQQCPPPANPSPQLIPVIMFIMSLLGLSLPTKTLLNIVTCPCAVPEHRRHAFFGLLSSQYLPIALRRCTSITLPALS